MAEFSGGKKLEETLRKVAEKVGQGATLRVGFLSGAKYPDGTPVAMIAMIQNFGAPGAGIPPRPFFTVNFIQRNQASWPKAVAGLLEANGLDTERALTQAGAALAGQLKQAIVDTNDPPLAPYTLWKRGYKGRAYNPKDPATFGAKPLIHTAHMINSVNFEVDRS